MRFYVNGTTGSDTLDNGRGESEDKPFKTIQACVNYVADNYNISRYNAYINVAAGTYPEQLNLGSFSRSTGQIVIQSSSASELGSYDVTISQTGAAGVRCSGGSWKFSRINFSATWDMSLANNNNAYPYIAFCTDAILRFGAFSVSLSITGESTANVFVPRVFWASSNGILYIDETTDIQKIILNKGNSQNLYVFAIESGGTITTQSSNASQDYCKLIISGSPSCFCYASGGYFGRAFGGKYAYIFDIGEETITGLRYRAQNGGTINTNGGGAEYFPGDQTGVVEASTYSWYK